MQARCLHSAVVWLLVGAAAQGPPPVVPLETSGLRVKLTEAGQVDSSNHQSPVSWTNNRLLILDQANGIKMGTFDPSTGTLSDIQTILDVTNALRPDGIPLSREGGDGGSLTLVTTLVNAAPSKVDSNVIYVMLTAAITKAEVFDQELYTFDTAIPLPFDVPCTVGSATIADCYHLSSQSNLPEVVSSAGPFYSRFSVLFRYTWDGSALSNPQRMVAFEIQLSKNIHRGGGLVVHESGGSEVIIFASGDSLPQGVDGFSGPQGIGPQTDSLNTTPGKIFIIDPSSNSVKVAALGFRNPQHLDLVNSFICGSDIGGKVAEEINCLATSALLDTGSLENFGWGRAADGKAREANFYVAPGQLFQGGQPQAVGTAPSPEIGYIQPIAAYGRNEPNGGFAISGPVASEKSFSQKIKLLFGDLSTGRLYATTDPDLGTKLQTVQQVQINDASGEPVSGEGDTLKGFNGNQRVDPRFFAFPDGTAGVLLEKNGKIYAIEELQQQPQPEPEDVWMVNFFGKYVVSDLSGGVFADVDGTSEPEWRVWKHIVLSNGKSAFKSWNGKYMAAEKNGGVLNADRNVLSIWEQYTLAPAGATGAAWNIKSFHNLFIASEPDGTTIANRVVAAEWETISLVPPDGPTDTELNIKSFHGLYLVSDFDSIVRANRALALDWERWARIDNKDGTVSFRSFFGFYLTATLTGEVSARAVAISDLERWTEEATGAGTTALKSFHGKYLVAEKSDNSVAANRAIPGIWEQWTLETAAATAASPSSLYSVRAPAWTATPRRPIAMMLASGAAVAAISGAVAVVAGRIAARATPAGGEERQMFAQALEDPAPEGE